MGFFDKTLYLRTFFIILPIGIAITYASYKALRIPSGLDGLNYNKGVISHIEVKNDFEPGNKTKQELLVLYIANDNTQYFRDVNYLPDSLINNAIKGDSIEVWSNNSGRFWQLKVNGQMLLKYKSGSVLWFYGLFLFGVATIVLAVYYLIKSMRDYLKTDQEKED